MRSNDTSVFPEFITSLPHADIPLEGLTSYLMQAENQQVIFFDCQRDVEVPEHSHEAQWGVALDGRMELKVDGEMHLVKKGDTYYVPKGVRHSAIIKKGYKDITFFNQKDRYKAKTSTTG